MLQLNVRRVLRPSVLGVSAVVQFLLEHELNCVCSQSFPARSEVRECVGRVGQSLARAKLNSMDVMNNAWAISPIIDCRHYAGCDLALHGGIILPVMVGIIKIDQISYTS